MNLSDTIPPLDNGMPRASFVQPDDGGPAVAVLLTEDMPVEIMLVDSGLRFAVDTRGGKLWVRAERVEDPPRISLDGR